MSTRPKLSLIAVVSLVSLNSLAAGDTLFDKFENPPAEARPFVRWWWGENSVVEEDILREIEVMQQAGIGGFEINPIALPVKTNVSSPSLQWLGPEFNRMVKVAVEATKEQVFGGRLGSAVRAIFCDSIELSAANWTTDTLNVFKKQHGYDLMPYLPYIVDTKRPIRGQDPWSDRLRRVRYDYSKTLVAMFHERFIRISHKWCNDNGCITPWYLAQLWKAFSHCGSSADHVSEPVRQQASSQTGKRQCCEMIYDALIVAGAKSLEIKVTTVLHNYTRTFPRNTGAGFWTQNNKYTVPAGLLGPVQIMTAQEVR